MGLPLSIELGIAFGFLIVVAFGAGTVKLLMNKRRLKINQKKEDEKAAAKSTDREELVGQRTLEEGDLFGVRALEHGYFGGVAQSRPSSPAPSYKLAPEAKVVDWGQMNNLRSDSSSVASSNFDDVQQGNSSTSSLPARHIRRPSPLRSQPIAADLKVHNMSSVGNRGGNFMPPPSPRSIKGPPSVYEEKEKSNSWVSPLDVHFSKPTTPTTPAKPVLYLPQLKFPSELGKIDLSDPLSDSSALKAQSGSIVEPVIVKPPPVVGEQPKTPREIYAEFSQQAAPSRYGTQTSSQTEKEKSTTRSQASSTRSYSRKSRSLSRTRDSVKEKDSPHLRKASSSSVSIPDSDMSVKGQGTNPSIDNDIPETENPFSNIHRLPPSNSSRSSSPSPNIPSYASASTANSIPQRLLPQPPQPQSQDETRLSVLVSGPHARSASSTSQNSIGEFYDSYYRQSTMGPGPAVPEHHTQQQGADERGASAKRGRKGPPPLLRSPLGVGSGLGGITEVVTPVESPLLGEKKFPSMI